MSACTSVRTRTVVTEDGPRGIAAQEAVLDGAESLIGVGRNNANVRRSARKDQR